MAIIEQNVDCSPLYRYKKPQRGPVGWIAYDLGRRLNHLRWSLELSRLYTIFPDLRTGPGPLLQDLLYIIRGMLTTAASLRVEQIVLDSRRDWEGQWRDDTSGSDKIETERAFLWMAKNPESNVPEYFNNCSKIGSNIANNIKHSVNIELSDRPQLIRAIQLGELADRALRPLCAPSYLYREVRNPDYWSWKRTSRYRSAIRERQRKGAVLRSLICRDSPFVDDEDEGSETLEDLFGPRPRLPKKTEYMAILPIPGSITIDGEVWGHKVRKLCKKLKIVEHIPKVFSHVPREPQLHVLRGLVALLHKSSQQLLSELFEPNSNDEAIGIVQNGPYDSPDEDIVQDQVKTSIVRRDVVAALATDLSGQSDAPRVDEAGSTNRPGQKPFCHGKQFGEINKCVISHINKFNNSDFTMKTLHKSINCDDSITYNISVGKIYETEAWKEHIKKKNANKKSRSVRTKNMQSDSLERFSSAESDPSEHAASQEEEAVSKYLNFSGESNERFYERPFVERQDLLKECAAQQKDQENFKVG